MCRREIGERSFQILKKNNEEIFGIMWIGTGIGIFGWVWLATNGWW